MEARTTILCRSPKEHGIASVTRCRPALVGNGCLPRLATLTDHPPQRSGWLHEVKHDGFRTLLVCKGKQRLIANYGACPKKLMQAVQPARMPKFSAMLELLWEQCPRRLTALDAG